MNATEEAVKSCDFCQPEEMLITILGLVAPFISELDAEYGQLFQILNHDHPSSMQFDQLRIDSILFVEELAAALHRQHESCDKGEAETVVWEFLSKQFKVRALALIESTEALRRSPNSDCNDSLATQMHVLCELLKLFKAIRDNGWMTVREGVKLKNVVGSRARTEMAVPAA